MKNKKTTLGVLGTIGAILLGKLKYILVVFKFLKLQTLLSMFITLGAYAIIFGWKFAVALVYLLFVHEMGHAYAAKRIKLPVSPAVFIPFMGAVIGMKEMPKDAKDEGYVAYMGPLFGLLSFLPAIPLYLYTHEPFWGLLIILGAMINLFNLIPITPLDGGRIAAGISTKLWGLGIILLLVYSVMNISFLGFFIAVLGSMEWYKLYKKQKRLKDDQMEVQELEHLLEKIKMESHDLDAVQEMAGKAKWKITNRDIIETLTKLSSEIGKMKKELYLQHLSGTFSISDEDSSNNQQVIEEILKQLEGKVAAYKKEVRTTETYYKTDIKTKAQLFFIYIGLVVALAVSYYYGNDILMNHPEIQRELNR
ncbi:site-2 protease family protein [Paenibacillus sp. BSR1-1]|uniref:site-2 protease family protein n=1 Tax=Paenibacillus sp. BSR1-1 TaxID=3020845 RepID=UPI0025B26C9F|nr:site-2 protease family protein [Paenibacillus sp. BSR1-1]MDN3018919.1 site-2 protease family protein [Paenibacillus sp. BSR1-1]